MLRFHGLSIPEQWFSPMFKPKVSDAMSRASLHPPFVPGLSFVSMTLLMAAIAGLGVSAAFALSRQSIELELHRSFVR